MAKNFQGVMTAPKNARFTTGELADFQEPRPYDRKLDIIRATLPDFDQWYQGVVNLPAGKWRLEIDSMIAQLCDADGRAVTRLTTYQAKETARRCGCITCTGALENVKNAVMWYAQSAKIHHQARANRRYFIQQLRAALASAVIKHSGE